MVSKSKTDSPHEADMKVGAAKRAWPLDVRLAVARGVVDEGLPATQVAARVGVPYTTALTWVERYRAGGAPALEVMKRGVASTVTSRPTARREAILSTKAAHPEAGTRRVRDVMRRFLGIGASETTVRRVLTAEGAMAPRAPMKAKPQRKEVRFERAEPNQLWQSDLFTFLLRRHERIYVAAFLDDHSRYLVSLAMAHHQRSTLVLEALSRGIADYGAPREILTDQGRQYTAWRGSTEFEAELRRHGIAHIKSRPHHPQTCGKIERFWKTLWEELLSRTVFADFEDCQRRVSLFIQYYNFQRPHQALEGLTPADRFFRAASPVRAAIEATVMANALRLAREQPPRKPFYLVGRLGDRDLTISASGSVLKVRVGDEETTIPFSKEPDHEDATKSSRFGGTQTVPQTPSAAATEVAEELDASGGRGAQPLSYGALSALGREAGHRCDRAGEDLPGNVLPDGDSSAEGDADSDEPALEQHGGARGAALGGELADRAAAGEDQAPRAGEAPQRAAAASDAQIPSCPGDERASGTLAEGLAVRIECPWRECFAGLESEDSTERCTDPDTPWRALAVRWERKLCAERAPLGAAPGEGGDEREEELHAGTRSAPAGHASAGSGGGGPGGTEDGLGSGPITATLAQSLPDDPASGSAGAGAIDHGQVRREACDCATADSPAEGAQEARARERASEEAGGLDRSSVGSSGRSAAWADPSDRTTAPGPQEQHAKQPA